MILFKIAASLGVVGVVAHMMCVGAMRAGDYSFADGAAYFVAPSYMLALSFAAAGVWTL